MATNPTLLTMPIAENGQKNIIPATQAAAGDGLLSQSTGFPPETALPLGAGGKAPTREDFNGAFNLLSDIAFYSQKGWTFQYDATQAYYKGCIVMDATDGLRYECINDVAAGTILPSADTNNDYWREYSPGGVPLGTILPYAADAPEPPYGFLYAEGQAVSRTMYADYFALVGTKYGAGDGETTFNLPNPLNRYVQFTQTAGTVKAAGLPNITGTLGTAVPSGTTSVPAENPKYTGALGRLISETTRTNVIQGTQQTGTRATNILFDASQDNPIYGNSTTVTPPTITFRAIVKVYDAPTPSSAQIDLSQYASDLAARLTREQTPAFNKRDVITTSGTYTAPVTGWYKITVKGGGGGGGYGVDERYTGDGGGEGGTTIGWEKMTAGQTAAVIIGAGGAGGTVTLAGANGGDTSVTVNSNTYTAGGGYGGTTHGGSTPANACLGGSGTICGASGGTGPQQASGSWGGAGGGAGGGSPFVPDAIGYGGGGAGGSYQRGVSAGAGYKGCATIEYFDPTLM